MVALLQTFGKVLNAPTVSFPVGQASFLLNQSHQWMSSGLALIWRLGLDRQIHSHAHLTELVSLLLFVPHDMNVSRALLAARLQDSL